MTSRRVFPRSMGLRVLFLLLVACCLPVVLARAQVQGWPAPRPDEFKLSFGLGAGYTTNPGLRSDSGGLVGDTSADLRAGVVDHKSSPRTDWTARYDSSYTQYGNNSQFDAINHALNFDGRYLVPPRTRLNLFEHFFYSRNPLQTGAVAPTDEAVILTRQSSRWRSVTDAALDTSLSRSFILQIGASSRTERLDLSPSIDID